MINKDAEDCKNIKDRNGFLQQDSDGKIAPGRNSSKV
jgi:hypothetical protein